jgi:hypothetical protein
MHVMPQHVAHARSGDKGNTSNISVIAYHPALYPHIKAQLTAERFKAFYAGWSKARSRALRSTAWPRSTLSPKARWVAASLVVCAWTTTGNRYPLQSWAFSWIFLTNYKLISKATLDSDANTPSPRANPSAPLGPCLAMRQAGREAQGDGFYSRSSNLRRLKTA